MNRSSDQGVKMLKSDEILDKPTPVPFTAYKISSQFTTYSTLVK